MTVERIVVRKIAVTVQANAKSPGVNFTGDAGYRIAVREAARDGKANLAVIDALSRHFRLPKSRIRILRGQSSKHKIIEIA